MWWIFPGRIGLRTSEVFTRDRITIIIPNSRLVNNEVTNWSHTDSPTRFHIEVGVSYSSDIKQVEMIMLEVMAQIPEILSDPLPSIHLIDFGDSALMFCGHFYSREYFFIEKVKSDLRKALFQRFIKVGIQIPFPQRDVWFKNVNDGRQSDENREM